MLYPLSYGGVKGIAMNIPTNEDVERLGHTDIIVYQCLSLYYKGALSWDEMLRVCVVELVNQKEDYYRKLTDCVNRQPGPGPTKLKF